MNIKHIFQQRLLLLTGMISVLLIAIGIVEIRAKSPTDKPNFTIRQAPKEVVLYTIYRGPYQKVGPAIGKLYALAGQKGITPRGSAYHVYLNNPKRVSSEHLLTEIRIPVGKDALKFSGSLGDMTDIKNLPAGDVVVAVKPEGQSNPGPIYDSLYKWILQNGYIAVDSPREVFLTNVMSGDYKQMKTEIAIPIERFLPTEPAAEENLPR